VLGITPSDFVAALEELELAGLLTSNGSFLRVKHELIADVTVGIATLGAVSFLRTRIAELLEADAEALQSVELLSDALTHWEKVGEGSQVLRVGVRLGNRFHSLGMGSEAQDAFARAGAYATLPTDRRSVLEGQMRAACLCADGLKVGALFEQWSGLVNDSSDNALEFRLLAAEAQIVTTDEQPKYSTLLSLSRDQRLAGDDRARALAVCAMAADLFYDAATVQQVRDELTRLPVMGDSIYGLLAHLVCRVVSGTANEVLLDIEPILDACRRHSDARVRMVGPRWASSALRRIGEHARRVELANESLEQAVRYRLKHHEVSCWEHLCDSYMQMENWDQAAMALSKLEAACPPNSPSCDAFRITNTAMFAYCVGDRSTAKRVLPSLESDPPFTPSVWRHVWLTSRVAATLVVGPDKLSKEELAELTELQMRAMSVGPQEDTMTVLVDALCVTGAQKIASDLLRIYFRSRRSGSSPCAKLGELCKQHELIEPD
jgi:hypothetical protein